MEAFWVEQRARLRFVLRQHPDWTCQQIADAVGCSKSTVSKWKHRFARADPTDVTIFFSRSRARHHLPPSLDEEVVTRLLEIRLQPPDGFNGLLDPRRSCMNPRRRQ